MGFTLLTKMNGDLETVNNWKHKLKKEDMEAEVFQEGFCGIYTSKRRDG